MSEQQHQKKVERIALQLNKTGLSYLEKDQRSKAFEYFKQAEKILDSQCQVNEQSLQIPRYQAVTYNNLAIYYKRTNKPKAALTYLKKAIELETYKLKDYHATASTHLNICAIYSYIGKHQEAVQHALLAIQMSGRQSPPHQKTQSNKKQDRNQIESSQNKIKIAAFYNLAVQYEHLNKYQQALENYKLTKDIANKNSSKQVEQTCQECIKRVQIQIQKNKKKMIQNLLKKKQSEQKGHYNSMRRNKKNFASKKYPVQLQQTGRTRGITVKKYQIYQQKPSHSVEKLHKIKSNRGKKNSHESTDAINHKKIQQTNKINVIDQ